jgi:hypothetical protein
VPLVRGGRTHGQIVDPQHDVGGQDGKQAFEVALTGGGKESADQLTVPHFLRRCVMQGN